MFRNHLTRVLGAVVMTTVLALTGCASAAATTAATASGAATPAAVHVTAATPVVPGSGTGSYRGIRGSFTITVTGDEVHVRPCPPDALKILRQYAFLAGPGHVSLG